MGKNSHIPGSKGLYFNYTAFTQDGKEMVYAANHSIYVVNIHSRESRLLVSGSVKSVIVDKNSLKAYFQKTDDTRVYSVNAVTGEILKVADLPYKNVTIHSVNADGTLLSGTYTEGEGEEYHEITLPKGVLPTESAKASVRSESKIGMVLFTLNLSSQKVRPILHSTDWLGHVQFSPRDPSLLLYCHEGHWEDVDRIWTIKADGTGNTLVHKRAQPMEIAGHEFWDEDGKTVWYDLQVPMGKTFFLASYNTQTGERRHYQMDANQWSIHFNGEGSSGIFCGDGGDSSKVAKAADGKWINLYRLKLSGDQGEDANGYFTKGTIESRHLVNLSSHKYSLEPNVRFSPDHRYVIFSSNMYGATYLFSVDTHSTRKSSSWRPFAPLLESKLSGEKTAIQVVDQDQKPVSGAIVTIKNLESTHGAQVYSTGDDGKIQSVDFYHGLFRFMIVCPHGECANTVHEVAAEQIQGKTLSLQANAKSYVSEYVANSSSKIFLTVLNNKREPLSGVRVLVRTGDAAQEVWGKTNEKGIYEFAPYSDPATVVILHKKIAHKYVVSSNCSSANSQEANSLGCIDSSTAGTVILPE
ncbi:oligogalacturonate lyase family protein (plasmid) [Telmatobacter bradus]|uniref:oligogalacturonate lyase family protein n=1 Tax=Telmatobacter bradus TaxID=474953 RepID=UPI003B4363A2